MIHPDNNTIYKSLKTTFRLTDAEVVEIVRLGGVTVSKTQVNGWGRAKDALRKADPGSHHPAQRERRYKPMRNDEFWAFWHGLNTYITEHLASPVESKR